MFTPVRSPTVTHTAKDILHRKGANGPPFLIFRILRQTSWCHISQVPPPPRCIQHTIGTQMLGSL